MKSARDIKRIIKNAPGMDYFLWTRSLYQRNRAVSHSSALKFYINNSSKIKLIPLGKSKGQQFIRLAEKVRINPVSNDSFFYSFDEYVVPKATERILDNMSVDYSIVINSFVNDLMLGSSSFALEEKCKYLESQLSSNAAFKEQAQNTRMPPLYVFFACSFSFYLVR